MLKVNGTGKIIHTRLANFDDKEWLEVTIAYEDAKQNKLRVVATNSNGLLSAVKSGEDLVNTWVVFHGDLAINRVRSHYTEDGINKTLKCPEIRLNYAYLERVPVTKAATPVEQTAVA
jgi:hypothetical protein